MTEWFLVAMLARTAQCGASPWVWGGLRIFAVLASVAVLAMHGQEVSATAAACQAAAV